MTKKTTIEQFRAAAQLVHGDRYDYTKSVYQTSKILMTIGCSIHGTFEQRPGDHLKGKGCAKCGSASSAAARGGSLEQFIAQARAVHGDRYSYLQSEYQGFHTKLGIICPDHGTFEQDPAHHLAGKGCRVCGILKVARQHQFDQGDFLARSRAAHGDLYIYSNSVYVGSNLPLSISCRVHGPFLQAPVNHWAGQGCRKCRNARNSTRMTHDGERFVAAARAVHGAKFDYSQVDYQGSKLPVSIVCPQNHTFFQRPNDHLGAHGCPDCFGSVSQPERDIAAFMESLGVTTTSNCRDTLEDGKEIDIIAGPLAIEYNGLYWHSEHYRSATFHKEKTDAARAAGLQMIHIFEDEWLYKGDIVKHRLAAKLGKGVSRGARGLTLGQVAWGEASAFYEAHHLQGAGAPGESFALSEAGEIVACVTFGRRRGAVEVLRYASLGSIAGGFARLFKHYTNLRPAVQSIVSYSDLRWGVGAVYGLQGFVRGEDTQPGYFWVKGGRRHSREKFQKHKLAALLADFDPTLSEADNMRRNGYSKIFDCGHAKWVWTRESPP